MASVPAPLLRTAYRRLLRLSANGARPEVLGVPLSPADGGRGGGPDTPAPALPWWARDPGTLPATATDTRRLLRRALTAGDGGGPPSHNDDTSRGDAAALFAALKFAADTAHALHPAALPATLPQFLLPSHALLPGERADFVFYEPRYVALAEEVLGLAPTRGPQGGKLSAVGAAGEATAAGQRRYAHVAVANGAGTLATIVAHERLGVGDAIAVSVLAGPRLRVRHTAHEAPTGAGNLPLQHIAFDLVTDDAPAPRNSFDGPDATGEHARLLALGRRCVADLFRVPGFAHPRRFHDTAPPPMLDPERLGFWLLARLLKRGETSLRIGSLRQCSTLARLEAVHAFLRGVGATDERTDGRKSERGD